MKGGEKHIREWVSRVGAQGGGKTYQKTRPGNYYGALFVIVVLGLALVIYSRFEYQNPVKHHTASVAPAIGSTSYAALSFQACGTRLPFISTDEKSQVDFIVGPSTWSKCTPSLRRIRGRTPRCRSSGDEYPGMIVSSGELAIPDSKGQATAASTYKSGEACPAGTKYAGQTRPSDVRLLGHIGPEKAHDYVRSDDDQVCQEHPHLFGARAQGCDALPPLQATINAMFEDATAPTTTTTLPAATTTTAPTTTTSAPTTTTTKGLRLQSIILVGGKGTRLRPLTYETPKQMLPLVGVPMIECVLESLARYGVTEAILSLGLPA